MAIASNQWTMALSVIPTPNHAILLYRCAIGTNSDTVQLVPV